MVKIGLIEDLDRLHTRVMGISALVWCVGVFLDVEPSLHPADYYAVEMLSGVDQARRGVVFGESIPGGGLILPSNSDYRYWLYEGDAGLIGTTELTKSLPGRNFSIPTAEMRLSQTRDTDGDGLTDKAEWIIGTDATVKDTDEDGVEDGTAIDVAVFNNMIVLVKREPDISVC